MLSEYSPNLKHQEKIIFLTLLVVNQSKLAI